jgi:hypothetical protein
MVVIITNPGLSHIFFQFFALIETKSCISSQNNHLRKLHAMVTARMTSGSNIVDIDITPGSFYQCKEVHL